MNLGKMARGGGMMAALIFALAPMCAVRADSDLVPAPAANQPGAGASAVPAPAAATMWPP